MIKKEVIETETVDKTEHFLTSFTVPSIIAERTRHIMINYRSLLEEFILNDNDYYTFFVFCFAQAHYISNNRVPNNIIRRMIKRLQLSYLIGIKVERRMKELLEMHR
ncbi:MAG: hypothetical protein ACTSYA_06910 [Candidatus Kariarchaeaceae archaeon]